MYDAFLKELINEQILKESENKKYNEHLKVMAKIWILKEKQKRFKKRYDIFSFWLNVIL